MMGPFLMLMGIGLLYVAFKGKSDPFLAAMGIKMPDIGAETKKWFVQNIWDSISGATGQAFAQTNIFEPLKKAIADAVSNIHISIG